MTDLSSLHFKRTGYFRARRRFIWPFQWAYVLEVEVFTVVEQGNQQDLIFYQPEKIWVLANTKDMQNIAGGRYRSVSIGRLD